MRIKKHLLYGDDGKQVAFDKTPNVGGVLRPKYLIIHFTAGASASSSIAHLTKKGTSASAHLVIGRDGEVTQLAPFNVVTWHAGRSRWQGLRGMNQHSIGIEIDNAGEVTGGPGEWRTWFERLIPDQDVIVATHQFDDAPSGWHRYTEAQIEATVAASAAIAETYKLEDVLGHDDISPDRKRDPGPAFPLANMRAKVIGRSDDAPDIRKTTSNLNIRSGPGVDFDKLDVSPLAKGTRLNVEARAGVWRFVEVLGTNDEPTDTGWVHGNYIA